MERPLPNLPTIWMSTFASRHVATEELVAALLDVAALCGSLAVRPSATAIDFTAGAHFWMAPDRDAKARLRLVVPRFPVLAGRMDCLHGGSFRLRTVTRSGSALDATCSFRNLPKEVWLRIGPETP